MLTNKNFHSSDKNGFIMSVSVFFLIISAVFIATVIADVFKYHILAISISRLLYFGSL